MNSITDIARYACVIGMIAYVLSWITTIIPGKSEGSFVSTATTVSLVVTVMALLFAVSLNTLKLLGVAG